MIARASTARHTPHRPGLLARLFDILSLRASRIRLVELDDHILHDIGISRAEAQAEHDRTLWDAPVGWRR